MSGDVLPNMSSRCHVVPSSWTGRAALSTGWPPVMLTGCSALSRHSDFCHRSNALEMTVALRPEKVVIEKSKPTNEQQSHVKGIVEDFGYFGNLSIYRVRTESGHIIQVSKQNRDRVEQSIKWEDEVYLSWENDSLMLLGE